MSAIQNVAIIGATGALGKIIIPHLLAANFTITIISRPGGHPYTPPSSTATPIKTLIASYSDLQSLTTALTNQDALIEAYNPSSTIHHRTIILAALSAGVKHLLTPEFGTNTFAPNGALLPAAAAKITAQRVLEEELESATKTAERPISLSWTGIITSTWFDWAIRQGAETFFWVNPAKRTITRYGSGDQKTCLVHEDAVGQAVVTVLQNPEEYKNRPAYFASYNFSTNDMISIINELTAEEKAEGKWDSQKEWEIIDIPNMQGFKEESLRLWDEDRRNGVTDWLHTKAFVMQVYAGFFDEKNFFGFDFGEKVESGWLKGREELKESLRGLIKEVGVSN